MATERIDIVVTERGTRTVRRNIESLATAAERADSEFDALRAAISRITPTQQLNQLLQQINGVRDSLAGSRSTRNWMRVSIQDANAAIVELSGNLRAVRASMAGTTDWAAVAEFRQAEETLEDIIRKLQRIRALQNTHVTSATQLRGTAGVAPYIPQVVTLPETNRFARDAELAARNADRLSSSVNRLGTAAKGAHQPFLLLNRYVGVFGSIMIGQQLMRFADSATVVSNRVAIVSDSLTEATTGLEGLYDIARRTRTPIEEMAQLYQKIMMASEELGISQQGALRFVEAVGMGLAVQGSSANTARGALIQLSQAIGTDIVRAEEFNSILEGAYPIALAAARGIDETGGSVARLRRMVIEGEISSRQFFEAIMSQYPAIADMFSRTTPTISQSFTVLRNKMTEYISQSEEAQAISGALSGAILLLADNIEPLADVLFSLGIAWSVGFAASKILAVGRMATNIGLLATAAAGLKATLGFMGGPIVAGLALLAGTAFWVYQNIDSAADQIERLSTAMDDGVSALQKYNDWVQIAAQEQTELGGAVNLTTEAMLRQSRVELQDALRTLQDERASIEDNLSGRGLFNGDNMQVAGTNLGINARRYDNAELADLARLLEAIQDGTGTVEDFVSAMDRVRGAGPEVARAASDLAIAMAALPENPAEAPSVKAELWLRQAEEQLANIARAIGGFDTEIQAAVDATSIPEKIEALTALQEALNVVAEAGAIVRDSGIVLETTELLRALGEARQQEAFMLEALGANTQRLQELTAEAERFRAPMEDSAGAATDTEASLERISFSPLESGARGFADQLTRAADAASRINGMSMSVTVANNNNAPIMASYNNSSNPTRDQIGTNGLMTLNSGGSFTVGGNGGIDQNLVSFWASRGEQVSVIPRWATTAGTSTVDQADRVGQSQEYLAVLESINAALSDRYDQLTLNNEAYAIEQEVRGAIRTAAEADVILGQQDVELIRARISAMSDLQRQMELINNVGTAVFGALETQLNNFVATGKVNVAEMAKSIIADLAKIAIKAFVIKPLMDAFTSGAGQLFAPLAIPGYNEGADFTVGGRGGVDNNLVAFRASRGERVEVTPAGQNKGSKGNVNVSFYINTPDVAGFRRSEAQIAARMQGALSRSQRNM